MDLARLARRIAPLAAAFAATGCLAPAPVPNPDHVEPAWADNGKDTPITIKGAQFYPALGISAPDGSGPDLGYRVSLEGPEPATVRHEVVFVDQGDMFTLSAVVPAGLDVGTYGIVVETAAGQVGYEPGVLEVCDACIHAVALARDAREHTVGEEAEVAISLVDASDNPVPGDLEVLIELVAEDGSTLDGELTVDDLRSSTRVGPLAIRGFLGDEGTAIARPKLFAPAVTSLRVTPVSVAESVQDEYVELAWKVGADLHVEIALPADDVTVRAGESFVAEISLVDSFGNLAEGTSTPVVVLDDCGSWWKFVTLTPSAVVEVVPKAATGTDDCLTDALQVTGSGIRGATSATFTVLPGPPASLKAKVIEDTMVAGNRVTVTVDPLDAFRNPTVWEDEVAAIDDGTAGVQDFTCQRGSTYRCSVLVTHAGSDVRLQVIDTSLRSATSNAFEVTAGEPEQLQVSATAPVWTAGQAGELVLAASDHWGNPVDVAAFDEATVAVEGAGGPVACDVGTPGDGRLSCLLFDAGVDTLVVTSSGVAGGDQVDVVVTNGPLAAVDVLPDAASVVAGDALGVALVATDAWGNPWIVRDDGALTLVSDVDAFVDAAASIGPSGTGSALVFPTIAGYTDLVALRSGAEVGRSSPVLVEAGPTRSLHLTTDAPWAWVGEPTSLEILALDLYGNRTGMTELVSVTTASGAASSSVLVQNGLGEGTLTWDAFVLDDEIEASGSSGGVLGRLAPFSAVRPCAPSASPAVDVSFGGNSFARACTDAAGRAIVTGQVNAAAAPGAALVAHGVSVGSSVGITASSTVRVTVSGAGVYEARALAVQDDGCASELFTSAWLGPRDGDPVGPLSVSIDRTDLDLQGFRKQAGVEVSDARTCDGLPAAGRTVLLRTDRGGLTGPTATGAGLAVTVDATGTASATLDASVAVEGGEATVTAWRSDGLARGAATVTFHGDVHPPTVRSFSAEGTTDEVGTAVVRFSERMDTTTLTRAAVLVVGPFEPTYTVRGLDAGRSLAIDFDPPLGPIATGWQVVVQPNVEDAAGNLLAGSWSGRTDAWSGWFGTTSAVDPVASCALEAALFRPDGDDGAGAERDSVRFSFTAVAAPVWWSLLVTDDADEVVRALQIVPTGTADAWRWDGRDETGAVVPAGRYRLTVDTKGSRGNRGGACTREVTVDLVGGTP